MKKVSLIEVDIQILLEEERRLFEKIREDIRSSRKSRRRMRSDSKFVRALETGFQKYIEDFQKIAKELIVGHITNEEIWDIMQTNSIEPDRKLPCEMSPKKHFEIDYLEEFRLKVAIFKKGNRIT